jgi:hypothetical protein
MNMPENRREYFKKRYECRKKEECLSRKERYECRKKEECLSRKERYKEKTETLEGGEQKNEPDQLMTIAFICHDQDSSIVHDEQYWFANS